MQFAPRGWCFWGCTCVCCRCVCVAWCATSQALLRLWWLLPPPCWLPLDTAPSQHSGTGSWPTQSRSQQPCQTCAPQQVVHCNCLKAELYFSMHKIHQIFWYIYILKIILLPIYEILLIARLFSIAVTESYLCLFEVVLLSSQRCCSSPLVYWGRAAVVVQLTTAAQPALRIASRPPTSHRPSKSSISNPRYTMTTPHRDLAPVALLAITPAI